MSAMMEKMWEVLSAQSLAVQTLVMASVVAVTGWILSRWRLYLLSVKLPGSLALPLLGNSIQLGMFGNPQGMTIAIRDMKAKYGNLFRVWMGQQLAVVVSEPEDLKNFLSSDKTLWKPPMYDIIASGFGNGLLTESGPSWKKHHQLISPSFSPSALNNYQRGFDSYSRLTTLSLLKFCDTTKVDLGVHCQRLVSDAIFDLLFDTQLHFYDGRQDHFLIEIKEIPLIIRDRMSSVWLHPEPIFKLTSASRRLEYLQGKSHKFAGEPMSEKIDHYLANGRLESSSNSEEIHSMSKMNGKSNGSSKEGRTIGVFEAMAKSVAKGDSTKQELLDEFNNIFGSGHDGITSQLVALVLMLGMHKRCQDLVWEEVRSLYSKDLEAEVKKEDLDKLPYLDLCVKETLRLFPKAPLISRKLKEDFHLTSKNVTIPSGTVVMMSSYVVHRDPKLWSQPNYFVPERFLPEESSKRPSYSYFPFSAGGRDCIAKNFATDLMKTCIVHLLRKMEFHSTQRLETMKISVDIATRCLPGYNFKLTKREINIEPKNL